MHCLTVTGITNELQVNVINRNGKIPLKYVPKLSSAMQRKGKWDSPCFLCKTVKGFRGESGISLPIHILVPWVLLSLRPELVLGSFCAIYHLHPKAVLAH